MRGTRSEKKSDGKVEREGARLLRNVPNSLSLSRWEIVEEEGRKTDRQSLSITTHLSEQVTAGGWKRNEREKKKEEERNKRVKAVFPRSQIFKSEPWAEISKTRWWVLVWNWCILGRGDELKANLGERERKRAKKETKGEGEWDRRVGGRWKGR